MAETGTYIRWFGDLSAGDTGVVGGKNASLGEMVRSLRDEGVRVPDGFATTARAYRTYIEENQLGERIHRALEDLRAGRRELAKVGDTIRRLIRDGTFPRNVEDQVRSAYRELSSRYGGSEADVAVRSSATAEDLPEASFAGQQETFLNIAGEDDVLDACRRCYASLFTDRAISYREEQGFEHMKIALSVGVQKMVRSDLAGSGVMFTLDTDSGFRDVVLIDAAWGLGENVVQGSVNPDEYVVFKPLLANHDLTPVIDMSKGAKEKKLIYTKGGSATTRDVDTSTRERKAFVLSKEEILVLARWGAAIEKHYNQPMDIEWAKDGTTGDLFIVQARPETVQARKEAGQFRRYRLKESGTRLVSGLAIGDAIARGEPQVIRSPEEADRFKDGAVLVTGMTDPDWVPIMKRASGIVTDHGGRTSHAAIVSRELGTPAIVGSGNATEVLGEQQEVTLSCAEGETGYAYQGHLAFDEEEIDLSRIPKTKTQVMMNAASPAAVFRWWRLPVEGIGLARMEFIINNAIKIHPLALTRFDQLQDAEAKKKIESLTAGYKDKSEYFVDYLSRGIARLASAVYPHQAIVRLSDFKTNEYANLIGGEQFEPEESNPMLGFRGASRYYSDRYRDGFALECKAIQQARDHIGLTNVSVMIPFCRTVEEADRVLATIAEHGLKRGENGLQVFLMAEIPSNMVLAESFSERIDGFSIGSNDLTQLVLGIDRDSEDLRSLFDERNPAVKGMIFTLMQHAHRKKRKVGICGQAPSDHPDFAEFLVRMGIDSMSLNPDSVIDIIRRVAEVEQQLEEEPQKTREAVAIV